MSVFLWRCDPTLFMASSFLRFSRSHTTTHHSRQDSFGRVISSSQRPLPDNTQHSQQTNIRAPYGIRTHDFSRRAAADLRLRPRGHWDRQRNVSKYTKADKSKIKINMLLELHIFCICMNVNRCSSVSIVTRWRSTGKIFFHFFLNVQTVSRRFLSFLLVKGRGDLCSEVKRRKREADF